MLSLIMTALLLPMTSFAQQISDDFFCVDDAFNGNRDVVAWNITNNGIGQSEAPVGSGLLILGAIGAGYAIAKRKRNKKGAALLLALALTLGFTQCKKKVVEPISSVTGGTTYHISVPAGDGSKVVVNPVGGGTYATVGFEDGDVIYVGYNNAYVGTITYNGAAGKKCFEGDITTSIVGEQPLHLYLLGGKGFTVNRDENIATVVISDQSSKYPVVSYSPTTTNFTGSGSYEATLYNKCSIMKFNVTTPSTAAVCITGMNNKVTVDFSKVAETGTGLVGSTTDNGFTYSQDGTGVIKMRAKDSDNATWAIVLPQVELDEGGANSVYSTDGYAGTRPAIHAIESNKYYNSGIAMTIANVWDGDLAKLTSSSTEEFATARDGMTIYGTLGEGVNKKVSIAAGATVTLNNVTINGTNDSDYKWAGITCLGDATIILSGTNNVKGFYEDYPGIYVPENKTVTIQGSGSLTASSNDWGAGIGGGREIACGAITISGGTITATGGQSGAGIGGGYRGTCGNITISGGTITATGGVEAAGIGSGGHGASCGDITISGGTVEATGGYRGAGIGTGDHASCGNITITSGVTCVTATKGTDATNSIGAGYYSTCGTVTIGGNVGAITTSPYTYPAPAATSLSELKTAINGGTDCSSYIGWEVNSAGAIAESGVSGTKIGYVAYVSTSDVDAGVSGSRILVIASADAAANTTWGSKGTARGLTADDLNGYSKTNTLQGYGSGAHPAAYAAWNYSATIPSGGATPAHWFMPTKKQWENMRDAKGGTYGAMAAAYGISSHYWTSTEDSNNNAWRFVTNSNIQSNMKSNNYNVRSIFAY